MTSPLCRFDGEIKTLEEWSDEHDMPVELVEARLAEGWRLAEALQSPCFLDGRRIGVHVFSADGTFVPVAEAAEMSGIPAEIILARVDRGWDLRAVTKVRPLIGGATC